MRVHYLAFLASSALSARVDGVVEPGASNQTALYFPAAVSPSIASDDDVTATRSSTRVGPPNVEERGLFGTIVSSTLSKFGNTGKSMVLARTQNKFYNLQKKSIRDNDVEHSLRNALEVKAWDKLYDQYKVSGHSMIDDLTKHYGDEMIARVLSRALRADSKNPAKFATATTLKEKLALDQLTRWQTKEKTLDDVFDTLRLNHLDFTPDALEHIALLGKNLELVVFARMMRSRKMKVLENYSKLTAPKNSEVAYQRAIMKGFGGEKKFFKQLRQANEDKALVDMTDDLEDVFLKMSLADNTNPVAAFQILGTGLPKEELLNGRIMDKLTPYVKTYNKNKPAARQVTVLDVLETNLGGERVLVRSLVKNNLREDTIPVYERQLYEKWYLNGDSPEEGLLQHTQHLSRRGQTSIKRRYKAFYDQQPKPK